MLFHAAHIYMDSVDKSQGETHAMWNISSMKSGQQVTCSLVMLTARTVNLPLLLACLCGVDASLIGRS